MLNQIFKKQELSRGELFLNALKNEQLEKDQLSGRDAINILANANRQEILAAFYTMDDCEIGYKY